MTFSHAAALALILCGASTGAALALGQPNSSSSADAQTLCQPDVFRLCNDAVPDEGKIIVCMKAKRKQLSPDCRKVFDMEMKKQPR